jgi:hypothetical protein
MYPSSVILPCQGYIEAQGGPFGEHLLGANPTCAARPLRAGVADIDMRGALIVTRNSLIAGAACFPHGRGVTRARTRRGNEAR